MDITIGNINKNRKEGAKWQKKHALIAGITSPITEHSEVKKTKANVSYLVMKLGIMHPALSGKRNSYTYLL